MPNLSCLSEKIIDRRNSLKLLLGGLCSATSASSAGAVAFGAKSLPAMATSDDISIVAGRYADLRTRGSVSKWCEQCPFSIAINTYGCSLPEWATSETPRNKLFLELVAVATDSENALDGSADRQSRVTFYDKALTAPSLPPSLINIAVEGGDLHDAMEGFVSTFMSEGFIGIDWADVRQIAGVSAWASDAAAPVTHVIEGCAFVLPGLAQSGGELAREVRYKLRSLAELGFDGGVLLNSRIVDANAMTWTLHGLDDFFTEALADREECCVAATMRSEHDRVCVYAFRKNDTVW